MDRVVTFARTLAVIAVGVATLSRVVTFNRTLAATAVGVAGLTAALVLTETLAAIAVAVASLAAVFIAGGGGAVGRAMQALIGWIGRRWRGMR